MIENWKCACGIENKTYSNGCGGCGWTYKQFLEYKKETSPAPEAPVFQLTANGKKICKACAEEIQPAALVCPHCRLNPDIDPRVTASNAAENSKKQSTMGIVSLVLAIPAWFAFAFWFGAAAVIFGIIGLREKNTANGCAIAGIIIGLIWVIWGGFIMMTATNMLLRY